jgi:hypothetical protein
MVKDEIDEILSFWRTRQSGESGKDIFRFKSCFIDAANKNLQPATYGAAPKRKPAAGDRRRPGKKPKSKPNTEQLAGTGVIELPVQPELDLEESSGLAAQWDDEYNAQRSAAVPYNLGLPTQGDCNMTSRDGLVVADTPAGAGFNIITGYQQGLATHITGATDTLDQFDLDPELAQITYDIQQTGYDEQQSDFVNDGHLAPYAQQHPHSINDAALDSFLDTLNNVNSIGFPNQLVLPFPPARNEQMMPTVIGDTQILAPFNGMNNTVPCHETTVSPASVITRASLHQVPDQLILPLPPAPNEQTMPSVIGDTQILAPSKGINNTVPSHQAKGAPAGVVTRASLRQVPDQLMLPLPPVPNEAMMPNVIGDTQILSPSKGINNTVPTHEATVAPAGIVTRASLRQAVVKDTVEKRGRGRPKKILNPEDVENTSGKRGRNTMDGPDDHELEDNAPGPSKKAKIAPKPVAKKPVPRKTKK